MLHKKIHIREKSTVQHQNSISLPCTLAPTLNTVQMMPAEVHQQSVSTRNVTRYKTELETYPNYI